MIPEISMRQARRIPPRPPRRGATRGRGSPTAGGRHRDALDLDRGFRAVAQLHRELERAPIARDRRGTVAANERAVGEEVVREVLRTEVPRRLRHGKRLARHRFDDVELAEAHEDLQRARSARD